MYTTEQQRYAGTQKHPQGPKCFGCGKTEAECASNYPCCGDRCSHTFGSGARIYECVDCHDYHQAKPTGNLPQRCPLCAMKHSGSKRTPPPKPQPPVGIATPPIRYTWYVSETGTAHVWGPGARASVCGNAHWHGEEPVVENWWPQCQRCKRIAPVEMVERTG